MAITKKILIIGALLLGIQPTTHAFTGDAYAKGVDDAFKAVAAIGLIAGAAAAVAILGYNPKPLNNDSNLPTSGRKFNNPDRIIPALGNGLAVVIAAAATLDFLKYASDKIMNYYHKTQINNFADQLLRQKDNQEVLFPLATWLERKASDAHSRNVIISIINNKKTTVENKIDLLLELATFPF